MIRFVLVRPEHDSNVGLACRAMKNFGFKDLAIVSPKCKLGFEAKKYAKHSREVLENAKVFESIRDAAKGFFVVGTSAQKKRFRRSLLKNCVALQRLNDYVKGKKKVAIVFGSEGTGLNEEETEACDLFAHIPASKEHPVLNLSHAVAVTAYALSRFSKIMYVSANKKQVRQVVRLFEESLGGSVKDKEKVVTALDRVLKRANPSRDEAGALLAGFSSLNQNP
jgi:tRNA/rRNA methyltransferase